MALGQKSRDLIASGIAKRENFSTGNKSVYGTTVLNGFGRIHNRSYREALRTALYVVYSYQTPIAWVDETGKWVVLDVTYSITTTHHQNVVRTAITANGEKYAEA